MDEIDKAIIQMLMKNCRMTYVSIAKELELTSNAIRNRIKNMIESGTILQFTVMLSYAMAGVNHLLAIATTDRFLGEEYLEKIAEHPAIYSIGRDSSVNFIIIANYFDVSELHEIGVFLRSFDEFRDVQLHPTAVERGQTVTLTKMQLRILKPLLDDAKMSISDIAKESGLTVRRVRNTLAELYELDAIDFTITTELTNDSDMFVVMRVCWSEKEIHAEDIIAFCEKEYRHTFWKRRSRVSASESVVFLVFLVSDANIAEEIALKLITLPSVQVQFIGLLFRYRRFQNRRKILLEKMIQDAGI